MTACIRTEAHTKLQVHTFTLKETNISLQNSKLCRDRHPHSGLKTSLLALRNKVYLLCKKNNLTGSDTLIRASDT